MKTGVKLKKDYQSHKQAVSKRLKELEMLKAAGAKL